MYEEEGSVGIEIVSGGLIATMLYATSEGMATGLVYREEFGEMRLGKLLSLLVAAVMSVLLLVKLLDGQRKMVLPPALPGIPFVGNMLPMLSRKPMKAFRELSEKYGDIFLIHTGSYHTVVISSAKLAQEVLVQNYETCCVKQLTTQSDILSNGGLTAAIGSPKPGCNKYMSLKKSLLAGYLSSRVQRYYQDFREELVNKMMLGLVGEFISEQSVLTRKLDLKYHVDDILYRVSLQQICGFAPETLYVEGLGELTKWEILQIMVTDPLRIDIDWRDYFPLLRWVPSKLNGRIRRIVERGLAVTRALIANHKKLFNLKAAPDCHITYLLTEGKSYLEDIQIEYSVWESIATSLDTTTNAITWAIADLARNTQDPQNNQVQERLYTEIRAVLGDRKMLKEEDLPKLPLLSAVFHESTRLHPLLASLIPRMVGKDTEIGGYDIPKGYNILINNYALSRDKKVWKDPDLWNPDRIIEHGGGLKSNALPFGLGKRQCVGMAASLKFLPLVIGSLVLHFRWTPVPYQSAVPRSWLGAAMMPYARPQPPKCFASPRLVCPSSNISTASC